MIHVFSSFFCLAVLSLPLTPSQLENEDVKVKKKTRLPHRVILYSVQQTVLCTDVVKKCFLKSPDGRCFLLLFYLADSECLTQAG